MTFATNSAMKAAVADYMARSDLTTQITDGVTLCEQRIYYGSKHPMFPSEPLRIRAMETSADLTISAQTVALPTRYLQARRIYINSNPIRKLDYLAPMQFWGTYVSTQTAPPTAYTVEGENIVLGPIPDGAYTGKILYYEAFAALSAAGDTNWLLTSAPGIYLYGTLLETCLLVQDDESAARWGTMFAGSLAGVQLADTRDRHSGAPLQMRGDTGNP